MPPISPDIRKLEAFATTTEKNKAMRNAAEIRSFIAQRINYIVQRPLMYGATPESVDSMLHSYYELLNFVDECDRGPFYEALASVAAQEGHLGSKSFVMICRDNSPRASDQEIAICLVTMWSRVGEILNPESK